MLYNTGLETPVGSTDLHTPMTIDSCLPPPQTTTYRTVAAEGGLGHDAAGACWIWV